MFFTYKERTFRKQAVQFLLNEEIFPLNTDGCFSNVITFIVVVLNENNFLCFSEYIYVISATTTVNGEKRTVKSDPFNHKGGKYCNVFFLFYFLLTKD